MTDIIPRNLIRHLEYNPNLEVPSQEVQEQPIKGFGIEDILNGKTFYNEESKYYGGVLEEALDYVGTEGILATMPELIEAKVSTDNTHELWNDYYTAHTEENVGIDTKGRFYGRGEPVLVLVNGGGLITPERMREARDYQTGFWGHQSLEYEPKEFNKLLDGKLPDGTPIQLHSFEDIKEGIPNLPHRFGIVMPYRLALSTISEEHDKKEFLENPLVIARAGGPEHLEDYFEKSKVSSIINFHHYLVEQKELPQGRMLNLYLRNKGMILSNCNSLLRRSRFLGVAPT